MKNLTHFIVFRILIKKLRVGILFTFLSFILINGFSQSADLIIQKTGPNQVYVGQSMQYTFVITNNGPNDVTNATWNDNLPTGMTNVTFVSCTALGGAVCPSGGSISISNTNFSGTIPFLPVNGTITMVIEMRAPAPANGTSFSNTATVSVPSGVTEVDPTTNTSTWNTTLLTKIDISVQKTVTPITSIGCGDLADTLEYTVLWVNNGPSAANGVSILDYIDTRNAVYSGGGNASYSFPYDIFGETWYSSSGTSTPSWQFGQSGLTFTPQGNLQYIGLAGFPNDIAVWEPGDTIRLNYKLAIQAPTISGCGRNLDSFNINNQAYFSIPNTIQLQDTNVNNNNSSVVNRIRLCAAIECPRTDISVQKTVTPITSIGCGDLADTLEYTVLWVNNGPSAANGVSILDYIDTRNAVYSGGGNASYSFPYDIFGETWYSSSGTSTPSWQFGQSGLTFTPQGNLQYIGLAGFPNDIAVWEPGDTIRLNYKLAIQAPTISGCGRNLDSFNINNQAYFSIPNTIQLQDTNVNNNNSSVVNRIRLCSAIECPRTDISVQKTVTPITSIGCGDLADTLEYTVLWVNNGPSAANGVSILDYIDTRNAVYSGGGNASYSFPYDIFGETWYSSSGTSTPSWQFGQSGLTFTPQGNLQYIGLAGFPNDIAVWEPGDTIRLNYKLAIQAPTISGCGRNLDSFNINNQAYFSIPNTIQLQDTNVNNNNSSVVNRIRLLSAIDMSISKSVVPPILNSGDSLTMTIILQNAPGGATANPAVLRDTLPTTFTYVPSTLVCTATGGAICGPVTYNPTTRVLEQINSNMPSNSQIIVTFKGPVQNLYTTTQTTSARAYQPCVDCVPATNFTQTNFQILGPCDTVRAGLDGDTIICDNSSSTIDLYSLITGEYGGGTWSRTSGMGGILNSGAGTFTPAIGATTSVFMYIKTGISACPNDTSLATIIINPTYNITLDSNICAGSSVSVCGSVYNTNGTHVKTCTSINGCDSIITLNLTVYPNYNITINATTCDPAQAGTVVQNLTTVDGCDSIITTITTLLPSYNITVNATTCDPAQVGTVVQNFTTIDGCDSIVTTITSLLPSYNITVNATTCDPAQVGTVVLNLTTVDGCDSIVTTITTLLPSYNITVNGTTCDPAQVGTVVQNLTTIDGCDSIVTTISTLLPSYNITVNATTCDPAQAGTVVQNLTTVDGCDSIVTTITILLPSSSSTINLTTCDPAQVGTTTQTLVAANGCDSIITTITTLLPSYNITINATTCNPAQAGTVVQNLTTINGCDSIITTITTLLPSSSSTVNATTCDPAQVGTTTQTLVAANGCDSIITTITTLLPSYNITVNATTCNPAQAGTVVQNLTTINGCDSIVTTITTLLPSSSSTVNATTCDPAQVGTTTQTLVAANGCDSIITTITTLLPSSSSTVNLTTCDPAQVGTTTQTLVAANGCDSIITTITTLLPSYNITINATTCNPAQAGTVVQNLTTINGCDSIVTTITTLLPSSSSTVNATTCDPAQVGTTTQTLVAANGCDSIITTITTLLPSSSSTVNLTTCDPAQVGTTTQTLVAANGCDSIITTITTLLPSYNITINATTCNPAQAGTVVQNLTTINGCDSIVTTITTLLPSSSSTVNLTTCDPAQVGTTTNTVTAANGCDSLITTITTLLPSSSSTVNATTCDPAQVGTTTNTVTAANGCDSIITTITTLAPYNTATQNISVCFGGSITVCGNVYNTSGTYIDTCLQSVGCDSIITTNLTVEPQLTSTVNATTCDPAQVGTTTNTVTASNGCDSLITTITTLLPSSSSTVNATTCDPAQVGTTTNTVTAANGCDSVITTITTLLPSSSSTVNATTCDPAQVGTTTNTVTAANGCDSIITTITTLAPYNTATQNINVCFGGSITVCGNVHNTSGTYIDTCLQSVGCDSIITTNLTVEPQLTSTVNATTCDPAQVGTTTNTVTASNGCDSLITTITTLLPSSSSTVNATTCDPAQVGTTTNTVTAANGCDSVITTITTLLPSSSSTVNATTCDPAQVGTTTNTVTAANGCDSVITTITTLAPYNTATQNISVCFGGSITVCGNVHNTSGTYIDTCIQSVGCDSIITTNLTVEPQITSTVNATTCDPAQVGTTTNTVTASNGCDSVITTITTLLPSSSSTVNATTCDPAQVGTTTNTVTAANGCDSVITTITTLAPYNTATQNISVCFGGSITVCGNVHNTSGTYIDTCIQSVGCDSIITTNLTVEPQITSTVNATTCDPAQVGTTTNTVTASNGCDSVITTITTLAPYNTATQNISVCFGGSITVCGNVHNTSGTYIDTCLQSVGCDSIITTNLTVEPQITSTVNATTCDPAQVGTTTNTVTASNGCDSVITTITTLLPSSSSTVNATTCDPAQVGTTTNTVTAANGCDSVITTITTLAPYNTATQNISVCFGGSITVCGNVHNTSGTYIDTCLQSVGCDSIITTNLTVEPQITSTVNATTCDPAQVGTTTNTVTASNGCDSVITTITTLLSPVSVGNIQTICNVSSLTYTVSFDIIGVTPFIVTGGSGTLNGGSFTSDDISTSLGYNFNVSDANGCNTINVNGIAPNCIVPCPDTLYPICPGESYTLEADSGYNSYQWYTISGNDTLPISNAINQNYIVTEVGIYIWRANGDTNCAVLCCPVEFILGECFVKDTIRDTLYINDSTTVCDAIFENSVNGTIVSSTLCDGSTNSSSQYGSWTADGDGCISYNSNDIVGYNLDTICVVTIDEDGDIDTTIYIISILPRPDTIRDTVCQNCVETYCPELENGMNPATTTITLCDGSTTGTGNGTWTIVNGCLEFTADQTVGRDTICVVACDASTGICDTTVYIIDVLPLKDTIRDTLYINDSTTVCDAIFENSVNGTIVSSTLCDGSTNSSSQYGSWTADGDGCISYNSNDIVGYNLDTICVVTIDEDGDIDTTIYIISILPRPDTIRDTVCQNCTETYCPELENGMNPATTTVTLCDGSTTGTGNGTWTIVNGCLEFTADETVGRDTICVVACDASTGICDTTVYIIDVLPLHDTIRDTLYINDSTTVCDALFENGVDGTIVSSTLCDGSTGSSSQYGSWTADGDGCISYNSNDIVGYNLDTICVVTIDEDGDIDTTIYIISILPRPDTIRDTVCQNCVETYCPVLENGMNPATTTITLCDGSTTGTGNGVWSIVNGCLEFTADETVGRDTICVVACDASTGICDTTVYIIDVLPLHDTIRDTLYINDSTTVCDALFENGVDGTIVSSTLCDGSTGSSSQYGSWTADGDGCISYNSNDIVGYNLDTICVVTIDEDGDIDTTIYIISILPRPDTIRDTVCQNCVETYCPELENGMNPATTTVTLCDGSTTGTGNGTWTIVNGCLEFTADETVGRDTICVVACDASSGICDTTVYIIDVLPSMHDTIYGILPTDSTIIVCDLMFENGTTTNIVNSEICGGGDSGFSQYGNWTVNGDGCITYNSYQKVGNFVDYICVATEDEDGNRDTTIFIISIYPRPDTIRDTVCQNCTETYCPVLEDGMNPATTTVTLCDGSTAGTGNGSWTIVNGCLEFTADQTVGRDTICVVACDASSGICDTTVYIIDVLPLKDTIRDTLYINDSTTVCDAIFENGVDGTIVSSTLCDGSTTNSSLYGNWIIDGDGCITYYSNDISGNEVDTICVVTIDEDGDIDSTIFIISILPRANIGNYVWSDLDGDGVQEDGEPGIEGVLVYLIDGITGDTLRSTTTDVNGLYLFTNVPQGSYQVGFDVSGVSGNYVGTIQNAGGDDNVDSDADSNTGLTGVFNFDPTNGDDLSIDAGFIPQANIGNYVWSDLDGDGVQEDGEPGIEGVLVYLIDGITGDTLRSTTTDVNGLYLFTNVPQGSYQVGFDVSGVSGNYVGTIQNAGGDDNVDSDADSNTGLTGVFNFDPTNGDDLSVDAGFIPQANIGNYVWSDLDGDGVQEDGEPGIEGVLVYLIDGITGDTLRSTTTDVNGLYLFTNVPQGSYQVGFDISGVSGNYVGTIQNAGGDDNVDSDADSNTGLTGVFNFDPTNGDDLSVDAGFIPQANIGNYVWSDLDGDGVQEDGEPGIEGVLVYLIDGITGDTLRSTTTDVNGLYLFTNVPQGSYQVGFDISGVSGNYVGTIQNAGGDDNVDSDADSNTGLTGVFNFDPTNGDDLSVDAGFIPQANIGNYVWSDLDGDGVQEDGEPGIEGVLVYLIDGITGDTLRSTTTDVNGLYLFTNVPQGSYQVGFDVSGVSGNYVGTIQNAGGDDNVDSDADSNTGLTGVFNFDPTNGDDLSIDAGFISPCDILPLSATIPCDIDGFSDYCIPVAYADIFNYDIYIDAEQYFNLPFICDLDTIGGYDFTTAINQGAYGGSIHRLLQWTVNGTLYNLNRLYTDFSELELVMDSLDALGNWTTIGDRIEGGLINSNYGPIRIFHPELGAISITEYNQNIFSRGSLIEVPQGCHWVTLVNTQTGCTDSVYVCTDCLPTPDTIRVTIPTDSIDTICVTLEAGFGGGDITYSLCDRTLSGIGNFGSYIVTADGCLIYESDSISGIDTVCVIACDASLGLCDTTIIIIEVVPPVDTIRDTICTTCTDTICLDNDFEPGVITTTTLCDGSTSESGTIANIEVLPNGCVVVSGKNLVGRDTFCVVVCNPITDVCDTTIIVVVVPPTPDTIYEQVPTDSTITVCPSGLEPTFDASTTTYSFCDGTTTPKTGTLGNYTINATTGCVTYVAGSVSGTEGPICIVACDSKLDMCDTTIIIIEVVPPVDTIRDTICTTCTDTICLDNDFEPGVITTTTLCDGSTSESGTIANIEVLPNGCVVITGKDLVGRDTFCVVVCNPITDVCDTTIIVVVVPPTPDTIYEQVPTDSTITVCPSGLEPTFDASTTTYSFCDGTTTPKTGTLGNYTINATTGCVTYVAGSVSGTEGPICIVACDSKLDMCDTTIIIIEVVPPVDTIRDTICTTCTDTICLDNDFELGVITTTTLCDGSTSESGTIANIEVLPNGCVVITGKDLVGRDTFCVVVCNPITDVCDTTIIVVVVPPTPDTIYEQVPTDSTITVCPSGLEPTFDASTTTYSFCDGTTTPKTGTLGNYTINATTGCVTYVAGPNAGTEGPICIVACDSKLDMCDTTIIIIEVVPPVDTIRDTICTTCTDTICLDNDFEPGVITTTTLCDGSTSESGTIANIEVLPNGCVVITGKDLVGRDTFCVVVCNPITDVCDTTIIVVVVPPTPDTIYEQVPTDSTITVCPSGLEPTFDASTTTYSFCDGTTTPKTGTLGNYTINATTGCVTYVAGPNAGTEGPICIVACDSKLDMCDTTIIIIEVVPPVDTIRDTICTTCTDTICLDNDFEPGVITTTTLCDGSTSESGTIANIEVLPNGCVVVSGKNLVGRDTFCVVVCNPITDVCDTTIIVVVVPPTPDTIYEQVPTDSTITVCPSGLEPTFDASTTTYSFCDGTTTPKTGTLGNYTINTTTGCVTYVAGPNAGTEGPICIVACDSKLDMCDTTIIIITVVPKDCDTIIPGPSEVTITNCDSLGNAAYCLPIALTDILSKYTLYIDGDEFFDLPDICDLDTTGGYDFTTAIANGTYLNSGIHRLERWSKNGIIYSTNRIYGQFSELVGVLDSIDPQGNWTLNGDRIEGGQIGANYGDIQVFSPGLGARSFVSYNFNITSKGTLLNLTDGCHIIVVEENATGCLDSVRVCVVCPEPPITDTIRDTICTTCTDTICLDNDFEPGVITTTTLCDGSTSESGTIANIEVLANGCVVVSGKNLVGRDTFCVTTCDAVTGICDTTIIVVVVPPTPDTIYEQVPTDSTITVCPSPLEPTFNATTTTYSFCDGSTGPKSGTFGDYTINTTTGCITYVAGSLTGKDTICVVACDSRLDMCDTTIIIITVVPNCPNVILDDTVRVLCDGTGNGKYCLPIGLTDILSKYSVFIDGDAFFDLPDICDLDTTGGYDFTTAIAGGQYGGNIHRLEKWTVNGTMYAPALLFNNLSELTAYMNVTNPSGDWQLVGDRIVGGDISSTYGNLQVFSPEVGARAFVAYNQNVDSKGTEFTLSEGGHVIVVENNETGCLDSVYVDVICLTNDTIRDTVEVNQTITVCVELEGFDPATTTYSFCDGTITPKAGTLGNYTINPATGCVTYVAGDVKGNEEPICVIACDAALGVCDTTIILITVVPGDTTIVIPVCDTCTTTICLDTLLDITDNVFTFCDGSSEITTPLGVVTIDAQGCISYTATGVIGIDTLCIEHCDTILDVCIKDTVIIRIIPTRDTIRDIIQVGDRDSVCVAIENGMDADDVTVVLCAGPLDNITNVQTHVDGGCVWLSYTGTSVGVDQLCVSICDNSLNVCDTTVVIVTVIPNDTVIVVPVCDTCSETFCLDTLFDITNSTWTFCDGSTEITTPLGEVSIDGLTGCVTYTANGTIGFDTLCVIHCDTITGVCDTIDPIIKIIPTRDTIRDIITVGDRDSVCVAIENGMDADNVTVILCAGPLDNITNVQTNVDGDCVWLSYTGTSEGVDQLCVSICDNTLNVCDTTVVIITVLPVELTTDTIRVTVEEDGTVTACDPAFEHGVDGDNIVSSTLCDGTTSGTSIYGSYTADGNGCITYTANSIVGIDVDEICVVTTDIDGNMDTTIFIVSIIPLKDIIEEEVEVEDSIVICVDLPDGFSDPVITLCDGSTSGEGNFGDYYINSDGCLVYQAGTEIGKDSICVVACDGGLCDTTIVLIEVVESPLTIDTVRVELPITTKDTFCLVSELGEGLTWSFCDGTTQGTGTYGSYTITPDGCVIYTAGSNVGTDELCVVACNGRQCDTVILIVSVERPPIAVNDYGFTGGLPITIGVLSNDTLTDGDPLISGPVVISNPSHGTISVNTDGTITYTPTDLQYAGIDSLQYVICDDDGCDTAWVYISSCLIPQGISPNGDGDNDVLAINCIDDDNAELRVWNRWGAEVYRNQHYGVDGQLWGGTYQGEPLPDGTYYYCIKFNDVFGQSQVYSGFVVVHR